MGSEKWKYKSEDSPWSRRTLKILWWTQFNYITSMCIHAIVFMSLPVVKDLRRPGRTYSHDKKIFEFVSYFLFAFALITYAFLFIQIRQYLRGQLSPLWMLVMSVKSNACWVTLMIMNAAFLGSPFFDRDEGEIAWNRYNIMILLDCFTCLPSTYQMVYACIVFSRFKRSWKAKNDWDYGKELDIVKV